MTAPPAGALEACLALLEKATAGEWEVLGDNQGHPAGLEWTIEAPEIANEDDSGWIAGPHGGDGIATTGNPGCREDAEAMAAAVNFLRTHGPALLAALRLREGCEGLVRYDVAPDSVQTPYGLGLTINRYEEPDGEYVRSDDLARILEEGE